MDKDIRHFRKAAYAARGNREKLRELGEEFFDLFNDFEMDGTRCTGCGKPFAPGQRRWWYQGTATALCDPCFLDNAEAHVYGEHGIDFGDDDGGGTIWVIVEGEEEIVCGR